MRLGKKNAVLKTLVPLIPFVNAIAIAKENTELLEKVNGALKELIADGTVKAIIDKYIPAE